MFSLPLLTWMRFYGWLRIGLTIYLGYGIIKSAMIADDAGRLGARAISSTTAARLGLIAVLIDASIAALLWAFHPDFFHTTEFVLFAGILVFSDAVHAWIAVSRRT
jgi:hypothetical protein